jgi:hypothetical protein
LEPVRWENGCVSGGQESRDEKSVDFVPCAWPVHFDRYIRTLDRRLYASCVRLRWGVWQQRGRPGTNSLGTALASSGGRGRGHKMKGPALGTGNPAIDREDAKVDKMVRSICRGC